MIETPRGWGAVIAVYGSPTYSELSGGNVDMEDAWEAEVLVLVRRVCNTRFNVRLHHLVVEPFQKALWAALADAPAYTVRMLGGYCPRHQRHNPALPLSIHSYGAAVDFNWDTNPMGPELKTDLPPPFVNAFRNQGWEWGGDWKGIKDAMHFQYARGV